MSNILSIDENEISGFKASNTGCVGLKAHNAAEAYKSSISSIIGSAFYRDDSSNFRSSVVTLREKMNEIGILIDDANLLLDELIDQINTDIIEKENTLSKTITG